ncbi:hypothetical protein M0812_21736 [Anaeramoeba flamelloides]|uniref:Uncharacterized protein n=1 Tax=Anaeramoeba flamelloides TaxID=1746091 RepID=A0AAV7YSQ7_9EUKA|nr:hypothetical protein M0812_21736 [Anaeramoeba flamelloides]
MAAWKIPTEFLQSQIHGDKMIARIYFPDDSYRSLFLPRNVAVNEILEQSSFKLKLQQKKIRNLGLYIRSKFLSWRLDLSETPLDWLVYVGVPEIEYCLFLTKDDRPMKGFRKKRFSFLKCDHKKQLKRVEKPKSRMGEISLILELPQQLLQNVKNDNSSSNLIVCYFHSEETIGILLQELQSFLEIKETLVLESCFHQNGRNRRNILHTREQLSEVLKRDLGKYKFSIQFKGYQEQERIQPKQILTINKKEIIKPEHIEKENGNNKGKNNNKNSDNCNKNKDNNNNKAKENGKCDLNTIKNNNEKERGKEREKEREKEKEKEKENLYKEINNKKENNFFEMGEKQMKEKGNDELALLPVNSNEVDQLIEDVLKLELRLSQDSETNNYPFQNYVINDQFN